jgi:hypothetical protein
MAPVEWSSLRDPAAITELSGRGRQCGAMGSSGRATRLEFPMQGNDSAQNRHQGAEEISCRGGLALGEGASGRLDVLVGGAVPGFSSHHAEGSSAVIHRIRIVSRVVYHRCAVGAGGRVLLGIRVRVEWHDGERAAG